MEEGDRTVPAAVTDSPSITSLLEKSITAADSLDRLSFISIAKEYGVDSKNASSKSSNIVTGTSPRQFLQKKFIPRLRFAKKSRPFIYHQMSPSESDSTNSDSSDGEKSSASNESDVWKLQPGIPKSSLKSPGKIQPYSKLDMSQNNPSVAANPSKSLSGLDEYYDLYLKQSNICIISSSPKMKGTKVLLSQSNAADTGGADTSGADTGDVSPTKNKSPAVVSYSSEPECNEINGGIDFHQQSAMGRTRPNELLVTACVEFPTPAPLKNDECSLSPTQDDATPWSDGKASFWGDIDDLNMEAVSVDDVSLIEERQTIGSLEDQIEILSDLDDQSEAPSISRKSVTWCGSSMSGATVARERPGSVRLKSLTSKRRNYGELPSSDEFLQGVIFSCKYVGSMSLSKPTGKADVLATMRRVRAEYKSRGTKKKKVVLRISVEGLEVYLDRKLIGMKLNADNLLMMDPIHHIYFVSHDSQDSQIFSYISKRNSALRGVSTLANRKLKTMEFHCHVFKSDKKAQAALIVQCLGRIFDVYEEGISRTKRYSHHTPIVDTIRSKCIPTCKDGRADSTHTEQSSKQPPSSRGLDEEAVDYSQIHVQEQNSLHQGMQSNQANHPKSELEQQEHQISVAISQAELLRQQVAIETQCRNDAEIRCHQLLLHNKDLLEHINRLAVENKQLRERATSVQIAPAEYRISQPILSSSHMSPSMNGDLIVTTGYPSKAISPDSGHREMSTKPSASASDLYEEWQRQNGGDLLSGNSSYQVSAKCEQDEMIRQLSFRNVDDLANDNIQVNPANASGNTVSNQSSSHSNMNSYETSGSHGNYHRSSSGHSNSSHDNSSHDNSGNNGENGGNDFIMANRSFGCTATSPVLPHRPTDAASLLRTLMLSDSDKKLLHLTTLSSETGSKTQSSSVNDIYAKIKSIRRSLENMESAVGFKLPEMATQQVILSPGEQERRSNSVHPSKRHIYAEILDLREQQPSNPGAAQEVRGEDHHANNMDQCDLIPSKLENANPQSPATTPTKSINNTANNRIIAETRKSATTSKAQYMTSAAKSQSTGTLDKDYSISSQSHKYENVVLSGKLELRTDYKYPSDVLIVAKRPLSAIETGNRGFSLTKQDRATSSVTSLHSRYSPQKETTLSRKIETRQSSQTSLHRPRTYSTDTFTKEKKVRELPKTDTGGRQEGPQPSKASKSIRTKKINRNYSSTTYRVSRNPGKNASREANSNANRNAKDLERGFRPIQTGPQAISIDSLNSPDFTG